MKKMTTIITILCLVCMLSVFLAGCDKDDAVVSPPEVTQPQTKEESVRENPQEESKENPQYKIAIEEKISEYLKGDVKFDAWTNYRQWELDGLIYAENKFTQNGKRHTYKVRIGDGTIFYVSIDGETIYWDEDGEDAFLDS